MNNIPYRQPFAVNDNHNRIKKKVRAIKELKGQDSDPLCAYVYDLPELRHRAQGAQLRGALAQGEARHRTLAGQLSAQNTGA